MILSSYDVYIKSTKSKSKPHLVKLQWCYQLLEKRYKTAASKCRCCRFLARSLHCQK
jgi:hypothetical protein